MQLKLQINQSIEQALKQDIGSGDVTTLWTVSEDAVSKGQLVAKEVGIIAGLEVAQMAFKYLDDRVEFVSHLKEGDPIKKGDIVATVSGPTRALLTAERVALNFMQRMSGIATETKKYVDAVKASSCKILDTRKTAPGLRDFDKWAIRLGGGTNHRQGLDDMVLIKDNHIAAAGGIRNAVELVRERSPIKSGMTEPSAGMTLAVEVEVKSLEQLKEALTLKVDRILLDNMSLEQMTKAVEMTQGKVALEASGNVSLETVEKISKTGIDYISVGALTHSVKALDISFNIKSKS